MSRHPADALIALTSCGYRRTRLVIYALAGLASAGMVWLEKGMLT